MIENIKQEYKEEIEEIISALSNCDFEDLSDDNFYLKVVEKFKEKYSSFFDYASGCTKCVLIFEKYGFVIKIPFNIHNDEELCGAKDGDENWDYCSQEENYYKKAKLNGFEKVFLETSFLTGVNNYPIYIQPYAEEIGSDTNHNSNEEDEKTTKEIREDYGYDYIDSAWEADLFVIYGKDYYINLKDYIEDNIEDLHHSNIGYFNSLPVILDYAGYDS